MGKQEPDTFVKDITEFTESDGVPELGELQLKRKKPKRAKLTQDRHLLMVRVPREIINEGDMKAGDYFEFKIDPKTKDKKKPDIIITYVRHDARRKKDTC